MGRKPNKPTALNPGQIDLLRQRFLKATNKVCPEVVEGLKQVRGKKQLREWAEKFGIRGTWVEKAAESTRTAWRQHPAFKKESGWLLPVVARAYPYGHPDFPRIRERMEGFQASSYLFSPDTNKSQFRAALEEDLKAIDTWAASEALTVQKLIPGDLDKKMECAALYLYRGWTLEQVRDQDGFRTSLPNMSVWIRQTLKLLSLARHDQRRSAQARSSKRIPK